MGWDYYTFMAQPPKFLDEVIVFLQQESLKERDQSAIINSEVKKPRGYSRHG